MASLATMSSSAINFARLFANSCCKLIVLYSLSTSIVFTLISKSSSGGVRGISSSSAFSSVFSHDSFSKLSPSSTCSIVSSCCSETSSCGAISVSSATSANSASTFLEGILAVGPSEGSIALISIGRAESSSACSLVTSPLFSYVGSSFSKRLSYFSCWLAVKGQ